MGKDRSSLHNTLLLITSNVYFQPPASLVMKYPCIIYKMDDILDTHANDKRYLSSKRYLITVVDRNPDTILYEKVLELPYSKFETTFVKDNLYQHICSLYW